MLLLALIALFVVVGANNPRFVAERNLKSIFLGNAYIAVAAIGMSMVIISGNIDISVGSLIGVLATISGTLAVDGVPIVLCWIIPVIVSIAFTTLMGAMVAYLRIPSIVVSLGFLSILKGGLISATGGAWINTLPAGFHLAQMRPLGVPMPIYFMVVLTIARRGLDAALGDRALDLRGRRQRRGGAALRHQPRADDREGVRDPRLLRRHRGDPLRHAARRSSSRPCRRTWS